MAPAEDFLDKGKADKLFSKQQGKDLVGEDFLDNLIMETTETMESAIRGCAPFGNQYMDMGMEIDAITTPGMSSRRLCARISQVYAPRRDRDH